MRISDWSSDVCSSDLSTSDPNYPARCACVVSDDSGSAPLARFRALPGGFAPRDAQDLMAWPFFSLAKSRRTAPIDFRSGSVTVQVVGADGHGIAPISDADVFVWSASQGRKSGVEGTRVSVRVGFSRGRGI